MKQIIDYLWNASPGDALFAIALTVYFLVWLARAISPSSSDH